MSWIQAILLAILQGITELAPVSSLGHAVIVPDLLNWPVDERSEAFLPFLVVMHMGTAIALLIYFWKDWLSFGCGIVLGQSHKYAQARVLFVRLIFATLPAVVLGFLLEHRIRDLFASPLMASLFLLINGFVLFGAERIKTRGGAKKLADLSVIDSLIIGVFQSLALIPGLSRSGMTLVGGYILGLDHEDSARFSFLTGTPLIIAAMIHELPKLLHQNHKTSLSHLKNILPQLDLPLSLLAGGVAGVTAFISLWILMRWFKTHEIKSLDPFAYYCTGFGFIALIINIVAP